MMTLTRILAPLWQQWRLWLGVQTLLQPWDRWIPTVSVSGKRWGHLVPWLLHPWRAEICQDVKSVLQTLGTDSSMFPYGVGFLDDCLCTQVSMSQIEIWMGGPFWDNGKPTGPLPVTWNFSLVSRLCGGRGVLWLEIWWASLRFFGS